MRVASPYVGAAGPHGVARLIRGEPRDATVLGSFPTAAYLRLANGEVIALLTRDAVRLPLGLVLPAHSVDRPLGRLTGPARVGASEVRVGELNVRLSRLVGTRAPARLRPDGLAVSHAARRLERVELDDHEPAVLEALENDRSAGARAEITRRLLGAGPGLTPSGDDLLAGYLLAAQAFGDTDVLLRASVLQQTARTTDLSAALLRCACRGESIPQVTAVLLALAEGSATTERVDEALAHLGRVGHSSGQALARGVLIGARSASTRRRRAGRVGLLGRPVCGSA